MNKLNLTLKSLTSLIKKVPLDNAKIVINKARSPLDNSKFGVVRNELDSVIKSSKINQNRAQTTCKLVDI